MNPSTAPAPARFLPLRFLAWLASGAVVAVVLAWLSLQLQTAGFAPVGLLSLLLGAALGGVLVGLLRLLGIGHRPTLLGGSLLLAFALAGSQHWLAYQADRARFDEALEQHPTFAFAQASGTEFGARTFGEYLQLEAHAGRRWLWILDAGLIALAAVAIVYRASGRAYCNACRSWYRPIRSGVLRDATAAALAREYALPLPDDTRGVEFQLEHCRTGCGPARLALSWIAGDPPHTSASCWLSRDQLRQAFEMLER